MSRTKKAAQKKLNSRKRKAEGDPEATSTRKVQKVSSETEQPRAAKTKKSRPTGPAQQRSIGHDESIAARDPALMADFFAQRVAKHYSDSTVIEQQDIGIAKDWIRDTTEFEASHLAENLSQFLQKFVDGGKHTLTTSTAEGCPSTVVISPSGIRVADVVRELRDFNTPSTKVAKLIAKHQKLKDNIEYLSKTQVGIVVGTPARLKDLIAQKALQVGDLKAIVIDASYQDEKRRSLTDMPEVFKPLLDLLSNDQVKARLQDDKGAKLLVY